VRANKLSLPQRGIPPCEQLNWVSCSGIGLQRFKLAGARWSKDGARKLAKARAAFLSDKRNFDPFALPQAA